MGKVPSRGKQVDVDRVISLYKEGKSIAEVGRILGHHHGTIGYHLYKNNIEVIRKRNKYHEIKTEDIKQLYDSGMATTEIAEKLSLSPQSIYARLLKSGHKLRNNSEALKLSYQRGRTLVKYGEENHRWKGGKSKDKKGYIYRKGANNKSVFEHRMVWENEFGILPKGWVVHHLNGIKDDNRIENLCAMPRNEHSPKKILDPYKKRIKELEDYIKRKEGQLKLF